MKHEIESDEVECGYILNTRKGGGNFYGVCHGLDQAVSFIKYKSTYPKIIMQIWDFKMVKKETPGYVLKLPTTYYFKEGKNNGNIKQSRK